MKKLSKLQIKSEKLIKDEELRTLRGGVDLTYQCFAWCENRVDYIVPITAGSQCEAVWGCEQVFPGYTCDCLWGGY